MAANCNGVPEKVNYRLAEVKAALAGGKTMMANFRATAEGGKAMPESVNDILPFL